MVSFIKNVMKGSKEFYDKSLYVWRLSKKPDKDDLREKVKVVLLGMFVLGFIGFFISIIFNLLPQ